MKRPTILYAIITFLFLGMLGLIHKDWDKNQRWKTYANTSFGIEFEYPADGWEIKEFKREQPASPHIGNVEGAPSYYTHIYLMESTSPSDTSYSYVGDVMEFYSKAELLSPFYNNLGEGDGPSDDRGLWDEFQKYIFDPNDNIYHDFRVVAYDHVGDFRSLYRNKSNMIGLRQFDCNSESGIVQPARVKQCRELFLHILNSLRFTENI